MRTWLTGSAPAPAGRGSSTQGVPGFRTAGTATFNAFASEGTSRKRAAWYWLAHPSGR